MKTTMISGNSERQSPVPLQRTILRVLATHLVALAVLLVVLCVIVPRFVKSFADMGVELPTMTNRIIWISNLTVDYWYFILMLAAVADTVIIWRLASLDMSQRWLLTAYSRLCLLATFAILVWVVIAICLPTIGMNEALRG